MDREARAGPTKPLKKVEVCVPAACHAVAARNKKRRCARNDAAEARYARPL